MIRVGDKVIVFCGVYASPNRRTVSEVFNRPNDVPSVRLLGLDETISSDRMCVLKREILSDDEPLTLDE